MNFMDKITQIIQEHFDKLLVDYKFYAKVNQKLKNKLGLLVPFLFNRMQRRLWQLFQEDLAANIPIRWLVVKCRQGGCTVWITGLIYWLITMQYNKAAIALSYDDDSAYNIGQKYQSHWIRSHPSLKPKVRKINRDQMHFATTVRELVNGNGEDVGLDSDLIITTANKANLGRSYTFQYAHLSEYDLWASMGIDVDAKMVALGQAIPEEPGTFIVKETTALGHGICYEEWHDPYNTQRKIFISFVAIEEYRKDIDKDSYFDLSRLPDSRYGDEFTERENILNELIFWYPEESKDVAWRHHESMCRLNWRRHMIDNKLRGDKFKFKQEYPTTIDDAFNTSSKSIFDTECLAEMEAYIKNNKITPYLFKYNTDSDEYDVDRKFVIAQYGHLRVYENVKPGVRYVIGADGAQGIAGGDHSAFVILRLPELVEVASFNDVISPTLFAEVLYYISKKYNNALIGIERNDKGGYAALEMLMDMIPFPNLFFHIDPLSTKASTKAVQYGYLTNDITRDIMIRDQMDLIQNMATMIRSQIIIDQHFTFVKLPNGKIAAMPGKKDDLVMAYMIAVQISKQIHIASERQSNKAPKYSLDWWAKQGSTHRSSRVKSRR